MDVGGRELAGTAGQFAMPLGLDAANVTINCDYVGGGFGGKESQMNLFCAVAAMAAGASAPRAT